MSKVADVFETMEYGPAPESSERANEWLEAHGLNERVPVLSFYQAQEYWHALITELAASALLREAT